MQEVEAKFYVRELPKIERRLRELKARLIQPRVHEMNLRFDTENGSLRRRGQVLRLRQDEQVRITFKKPGQSESGVLSREEIEFAVEDFQRAKRFLEALGYHQVFFYEKYRTTYELEEAHFMLDELPYGEFVEIEGSDAKSVQRMAERVGLRAETAIDMGYHMLFEQICKVRRLKFRDVSFDNFKGMEKSVEYLDFQPADLD